MGSWRFFVLVSAVALGAIAFAGCGDGGSDSDGAAPKNATVEAPASVASSGKIRFCTDATYPPAEFMEGSDFVGFDIDIAKDIAGQMGVEAEFLQTGFDGIVAAVQADKCDALIAAMNVTPEREKALTFVRYGATGHGLMVKKGNPEGLENLEGLAGRSVAVQVGTTQKDAIEEENERLKAAGEDTIDVQIFPKDTDAASALRAGRVDAYFADGPPIAYYARQNPDDFEIAAAGLTSAPVGIGVRKDHADLSEAIEAAVDDLYESGRIKDILSEWNVPDVAKRS